MDFVLFAIAVVAVGYGIYWLHKNSKGPFSED